MIKGSTILVVDDEESIRFTFDAFLSEEGYRVLTAKNFQEASTLIKTADPDLIFADILLGDRTGFDLLRTVREKNLACPFVLITGAPDFDTAVEAVRLGAYDYIPKPVKRDTLVRVARIALSHRMLQLEKEKYRLNLEAIFDSVKDGLIMVDKKRNIVEINRAARTICRLSRESLGRSFDSVDLGCGKQCTEALKAFFKEKNPIETSRLRCLGVEGENRTIALSFSPLRSPTGNFSGAVMVVRDETRLDELERDLKERRNFHGITGKSPRMQEVYGLIEALADVDTTVLVTGESGTGKELVARALHYSGPRRDRPLVPVNCAALADNLLESELFGHVKGAFTGAIKDMVGRFQQADGGTLFLDEIGDISPALQVRLLRVLQEKKIERVGDSRQIPVNVRIVAATNQDLPARVRKGLFREDLFFRLKVVNIQLPPLRQRREDIPLLVDDFIERFNTKLNRDIQGISPEVLEMFMAYSWPGNVRELGHFIEHGFILCRGTVIQPQHLPPEIRISGSSGYSDLDYSSDDEEERVRHALEKAGWNKAKAARLLGISRRTLYRKISLYDL
jgi:two-component system response regulator HydG